MTVTHLLKISCLYKETSPWRWPDYGPKHVEHIISKNTS